MKTNPKVAVGIILLLVVIAPSLKLAGDVVTFRTNVVNDGWNSITTSSNAWIAVPTDYGELIGAGFNGRTAWNTYCNSYDPITLTPEGYKVVQYSTTKYYVCDTKYSRSNLFEMNFGASASAELSLNPVEPYTSNNQEVYGEGSVPTCVDSTWTPLTSDVCSGQSFTQTSNCGNERSATGTKDCASCVSHDYYGCRSGDVWWFNSCDTQEEIKEDCGDGFCPDDVCIPALYCPYSGTCYKTDRQGNFPVCYNTLTECEATLGGSGCNTDADTNCDGCVADDEFPNAVTSWKNQAGISDSAFPGIVTNWKNQIGC